MCDQNEQGGGWVMSPLLCTNLEETIGMIDSFGDNNDDDDDGNDGGG